MQGIFADGAITEKTRTRIQVDKTERIAKGKLRRRISNEA
jgi:hypothetical protein